MTLNAILIQRLPALDEQERHIADWFALLWSQRQNAFHIERVKHMLDANRRAYGEDRCMDYAPIFIGTESGCQQLADTLRGTLRQREDQRALVEERRV